MSPPGTSRVHPSGAVAAPRRDSGAPAGPVWRLRAVEPLLFRDGRPLTDSGGSASSLALPLPSTLAGCIRTRLGDALGWNWQSDGPEQALQTAVAGPLGCVDGSVVLPAPLDAVVYGESRDEAKVMVLRPAGDGQGCGMPAGLRPLDVTVDAKRAPGYRYWKMADVLRWLQHVAGPFAVPDNVPPPQFDERVHVALRADTGTADEGKLYTTSMVCYEAARSADEWSLLLRLKDDPSASFGGFVTPGGERRLASLEPVPAGEWPSCPPDLASKVENSARIRMQLATPALFASGWLPGWLADDLTGSPPNASGLLLRLVSAAVGRREPVSGWDYTRNQPKAVRWMAPAGSVYFFEVLDRAENWVADSWLESIGNDAQDQRDGFGLSLWGIW